MVSLRRLAFLPTLRSSSSSSIVTQRPFILRHSSLIASGLALVTGSSLAQSSPLSSSATCSSSSSSTTRRFASTTATQLDASTMDTGYLDAASAAKLDEELMSTPGFTLEQLMELAGLAVAEAVYQVLQEKQQQQQQQESSSKTSSSDKNNAPQILIICGPGNNGGDGLVAARHLTLFGYSCTIVYPNQSKKQPHYANLVQQCRDMEIPILDTMPDNYLDYPILMDAIFGFSFAGEPRAPFDTILQQLRQAQETNTIVAIDVPSGWDVNEGDVHNIGYLPQVLVSLTTPKLSAQNYPQRHFVGGRFLPNALAEKYNIRMPPYPGTAQVMEISRGGATTATKAESNASNASWEQEYADYLAEKEANEFAEYEAVDNTKGRNLQQTSKEPAGTAVTESNENEGWEEAYAAYLAAKEQKEA